ncbi:hypothetical protein [Vibrio sp. M260121]|uniref:hypothetical protein n=1 Tax=Vibrio sp. M260121 TaxID=3020897 RepID=UPI002F42ED29
MKYTTEQLDKFLKDVDDGKYKQATCPPERLITPEHDNTDILSIPSDDDCKERDVFERPQGGVWRQV